MPSADATQITLADVLATPDDSEAARVPLTGAALDSRDVEPGDLFMAVPGTDTAGVDYASQAVERGAAAIAWEGNRPPDVDAVVRKVANLGESAGAMAAQIYARPSEALFTIGVTGTNGKTTCAWLLTRALSEAGQQTGTIGTLGAGCPPTLRALRHTTPDSATLQRECARLRDAGAVAVAAEMSSHALAQGRPDALAFNVALLTGVGRDHLDYHGELSHYVAAKRRLFGCPTLQTAVLNADDEVGHTWLGELSDRLSVVGYGVDPSVGRLGRYVLIDRITARHGGLHVALSTHLGEVEIATRMLGLFNAANLAAVLGVLLARGVDLDTARAVLTDIAGAPGRMERIDTRPDQPTVVVDYAHTAEALTQALISLAEHRRGRLFVVFGCGGERDTGKRPAMGRAAIAQADVVIVTSDNPRGEAPAAIIAEIVADLPAAAYRIVPDRGQAVATAIDEAGADDIVLIAGKGHETTQQIGDRIIAFDDRDVARRALEAA